MKKKIIFSIGALLFSAGLTFAQGDWVRFTSSTPKDCDIQVMQSTNTRFRMNVKVYGMFTKNITEKGEIYQRIHIPGGIVTTTTGLPELPVIRKLIAIPECANLDLNLNVEVGFPWLFIKNIYPAPGYEEVVNPDGAIYMAEVFAKDKTFYTNNKFTNSQRAEIANIGYIRGQRVAEILIYPLNYNPAKGILEVYTDIDIEMEFINPATNINVNTGIFSNSCESSMLNYEMGGIGAAINTRVATPGNVSWVTVDDTNGLITADYLIIVAGEFFDISNHNPSIDSIASHRANYNGFDVAIVNVEDVIDVYPADLPYPDFDIEEKIRNFIKSVYENGTANHTYDGKLAYVLLIGDENYGSYEMPSSYDWIWNFQEGPSDYYYTRVTTTEEGEYDAFGDLYIGRFSLHNIADLQNIVAKTIQYEIEAEFYPWKKQVFLTAGEDHVNEYFINDDSDALFNVISSIVDPGYNIAIVKQYEVGYDSATQANIEIINNGCFFVTYSGHGNTYNWQALKLEDFETLENNEKQPFVMAAACDNGWFDWEGQQCFGEHFTNAKDKGAIGFLGFSRSPSWSNAVSFAGYLTILFGMINYL